MLLTSWFTPPLEPDFSHSVPKERMLLRARVDGGREPGFHALRNSAPHPCLSTRAIQTHLLFTPNQPAFLAAKPSENLESPWKCLPAFRQAGIREEAMREMAPLSARESVLPLQTRSLGQISPREEINREEPLLGLSPLLDFAAT